MSLERFPLACRSRCWRVGASILNSQSHVRVTTEKRLISSKCQSTHSWNISSMSKALAHLKNYHTYPTQRKSIKLPRTLYMRLERHSQILTIGYLWICISKLWMELRFTLMIDKTVRIIRFKFPVQLLLLAGLSNWLRYVLARFCRAIAQPRWTTQNQ